MLVNNAGISQRSLLADTDPAVMRRMMQINFLGPALVTRLVLPGMIARGGGQIAGTTSLAGKTGSPLRAIYCAAKHALHGFYDSLRAEVWPHGIGVTMLVPGFVSTDISRHALTGDGGTHGRMDGNQAGGTPPAHCARVLLRAVERGREEVFVAMGAKGRLILWLKVLAPGLLSRLLRRWGGT